MSMKSKIKKVCDLAEDMDGYNVHSFDNVVSITFYNMTAAVNFAKKAKDELGHDTFTTRGDVALVSERVPVTVIL
jgi:hypothetical protein